MKKVTMYAKLILAVTVLMIISAGCDWIIPPDGKGDIMVTVDYADNKDTVAEYSFAMSGPHGWVIEREQGEKAATFEDLKEGFWKVIVSACDADGYVLASGADGIVVVTGETVEVEIVLTETPSTPEPTPEPTDEPTIIPTREPTPTPPPIIHTITASAGDGGAINPDGNIPVTHGYSQTFTITANNGYHIKKVKVDGVSKGDISSYTFNKVNEDHEITAEFEDNICIITATVDSGPGSISPSGKVEIEYVGSKVFEIQALPDHAIKSVIVDGVSIEGYEGEYRKEYDFTDVTADHEIHIEFRDANITWTTCSGSWEGFKKLTEPFYPNYPINTSEFCAEPGGTYISFCDWVVKDGRADIEDLQLPETRVLHSYGDTEIYPDYGSCYIVISASSGANGEITPYGHIKLLPGESQKFVIQADTDYAIERINVDGEDIGGTAGRCTYEYPFRNVTEDGHYIYAAFRKAQITFQYFDCTQAPTITEEFSPDYPISTANGCYPSAYFSRWVVNSGNADIECRTCSSTTVLHICGDTDISPVY
jgi:hypothetical protein